jgi:hypothetical protein
MNLRFPLLAAALFIIFFVGAVPTEAAVNSCDTSRRMAFQADQTGWNPWFRTDANHWNQEIAYNYQMSTSNSLFCYSASQGYGGNCYVANADPKIPFIFLASGWNPGTDIRPVSPPEPNSFDSVAFPPTTQWASCAAFCENIEGATHCFNSGFMCTAAKLKPGATVHTVPSALPIVFCDNGLCESTNIYEAGTCTPIPTVGAPNLTAGAITPTSAVKDVSVSLSSLISNLGGTLTLSGFTNLFQIDSDTDHSSVTATRTGTSPSLAPTTSNTTQASYAFPTAGTWYARACADSNASWIGAIAESDETDNCGPWTSISVANNCTGPSCLPNGEILSCSASPSTVIAGGSTTWTASPAGLGTYAWTPSEPPGATVTGKGNTLNRTYSSAGTYAMSVSAGGATASCSNNVTVTAISCGASTPTITASPTRVQAGNTSTLTVSASGVDTTCTVTGPGVSRTLSGSSCTVPTTTITTGAITSLSTYTISCDSGESSAKVLVNVVPKIQEF